MSFKDFNMNMDDYNKQLSDLETNKEETKKNIKILLTVNMNVALLV